MGDVLKPRLITNEEKKELLSLSRQDYTMDKIKELIAFGVDNTRRFNPNDRLTLRPGEYYNKGQVTTTVGRLIFNKVVFDEDFLPHIGYVDETLDEDGIGDLEVELSKLVLNGTIETTEYFKYIDRVNWLGYGINNFLATSLTADFYILPKSVEKKKKELVEKYSEELANNDLSTIGHIEDELLDLAKKELDGHQSMEIFASGARGSFGNNYKNSVLMRGAMSDPVDRSVDISTHSLSGGIPKEEYSTYANLMVNASYNRAKSTAKGGYMGKKLRYAFQHVILDEPNSDCGTTKTLSVKMDSYAKKLFIYRYIVTSSGLVLLTPDNIDDYTDKVVQVRSPMYCTTEKICSKCAGSLYYDMGIKNIGLLTDKQGSTLMQISMSDFVA